MVIVEYPFLYGAEAHLILDVVHDARTRQEGSDEDDAQPVVRNVCGTALAEVLYDGRCARFGVEEGRIACLYVVPR